MNKILKHKKLYKEGFSLVIILVLMIVVGCAFSVITPNLTKYVDQALVEQN